MTLINRKALIFIKNFILFLEKCQDIHHNTNLHPLLSSISTRLQKTTIVVFHYIK